MTELALIMIVALLAATPVLAYAVKKAALAQDQFARRFGRLNLGRVKAG